MGCETIMEKSNSLQRVLTTLGHKEPDKVPLFLLVSMHGAKELGMSIEEYFSKPEQLRLLEQRAVYGTGEHSSQ